MKYVVTAAQMQQADNYTSEKIGLPSLVLMERAALSAADEVCKRFDGIQRAFKACIVCGNGNNGGDGFALGRILSERGFAVHFFVVKEDGKCSDSNRVQREILEKLGYAVSTEQPVGEYDIIVDAIFGTGLCREVAGCYREMIAYMNEMQGFKVALDIPSGIHSDDGTVLGCAFRADLTVTFGFYKWGHLLYEGKDYCGKTVCCNIGIPEKSLCGQPPYGRMLEREDIKVYLPKRIANSHKGTYGRAGIMAGSVQMGGAVALCSDAAMRTGVGYTKVMTAEENRNLLLSTRPEVLFYPVGEGRFPIEKFSDCNAIAAGPGMGTGKSAQKQIEALLDKEADCSLVLDADAINIMAERQDLKEKLKIYAKRVGEKGYRVILTPHQKEFSRFSGIPMDTKAAKRHEKALETAADFGVVLVLKDAVTRIYTPDGIVYVNTTGNPGMSTAGSGDVLTGIICGLEAQMKDGVIAAALGVYIHGRCGDYAAEQENPHALTAMDMAENLSYVLK